MKYRGVELKQNTEAELFIDVEVVGITDEDELEDYVETLEESLCEIADNDSYKVYTEVVTDNNINVRCDGITFDKTGVDLLMRIYNDILNAHLGNTKVSIGVHIDSWFKDADGSEYNEDVVCLDEFLENVEY